MAHLWTNKRGERQAVTGATDLFAGSPVTPFLSPTLNKGVAPAVSSAVECLGVVYQDTRGLQGAAVYFNSTTVQRMVLSATVATAGVPIGVVGSTNGVIHPLSGVAGTLPLIGPVTGATGTVVWQVGEAEETGIPGQPIAVRINPRQLSGLA